MLLVTIIVCAEGKRKYLFPLSLNDAAGLRVGHKSLIQQTFFGVSAVFVITRDNDLITLWRGQGGGTGQDDPCA